jgi:hypothetical protein
MQKRTDTWPANNRPITIKHTTVAKSQRFKIVSLAFCFDDAGFTLPFC